MECSISILTVGVTLHGVLVLCCTHFTAVVLPIPRPTYLFSAYNCCRLVLIKMAPSLSLPPGLWGVPGTQDSFLLPAAGGQLPLFPSIPGHPSGPVQTGAGLHHLGLQTHHEERGRHRWGLNTHTHKCFPLRMTAHEWNHPHVLITSLQIFFLKQYPNP